MKVKTLLLGAGHSKVVRLGITPHGGEEPEYDITSLDFDEDSSPDVLWDLEDLPLPFEDNSFDEIHAYEILEHTGQQGDWRFFFDQFTEFWRILRPDGKLIFTCPSWDVTTTWGDPSHKRVLNEISLVFLDQAQYHDQIGRTQMTDYRRYYKADFSILYRDVENGSFRAFLQAKKPVRTFKSEKEEEAKD